MLKVVLDTNVLVSAVLVNNGKSAQILERHGEFDLILSEDILAETLDVLRRRRIQKKRPISQEALNKYFQRLRSASRLVSVQEVENIITNDPPDNLVLACAVEGNADYLVSGNLHLLNLRQHRGIEIVTPAEFLKILISDYK